MSGAARISLCTLALVLAACQVGATPGAACTRTSECTAPLACAFGRCRAECREARDCPLVARCVSTQGGPGVCLLPTEAACTGDTDCPSALLCRAGACRAPCRSSDECLGDCDLASATCVEPGEERDGGVRDGGAGDAGTLALDDAGYTTGITGPPCRTDSDCTSTSARCDYASVCSTDSCTGSTLRICRESCRLPGSPCTVGSCTDRLVCAVPCAPLTSAGCGPEACTVFVRRDGQAYADCEEAGTLAEGAVCPPLGARTRATYCARGLTCLSNVCVRLCDADATSPCGPAQRCRTEVLGPVEGHESARIGICL